MTDKQRQGRSNRRRGADAERRVAEIIRDTWGYPVRRGQVFNKEPDVVGLSGIHLEVKYQEHLNVRKAMNQSIEASERYQDGMPVVIHGKAREEWLVTMRLEDWMDMYGAWKLPFTE